MWIKVGLLFTLCFSSLYTNPLNAHTRIDLSDRTFPKVDFSPLFRFLNNRESVNKAAENKLRTILNALQSNETKESNCQPCLLAIDGLNIIFKELGITYEELRETALPICEDIVAEENWRGDVLCPGVLDNYGPNVEYIIRSYTKSAERACLMNLNLCTRDEISDSQSIIDEVTRRKNALMESIQKRVRTDRRSRSLGKPQGSTAETQRKHNSEPLRILQVTDIHIDQRYKKGSAIDCHLPSCCREGLNGTGSAGKWGSSGCNIGPDLANSILRQFASLPNKPDIVIYGGDSSVAANWEETQGFMLSNMKWVANAIRTHFPSTPTYAVLGNHECFPTNLYHSKRNYSIDLNRVFTKEWGALSNFKQEQEKTSSAGAYYTVLSRTGLRILGYNSNFATTENWYNFLDDTGYNEMISFMSNTLQNAKENNEKVIIIGHHPPGEQSRFQGNDIKDLFIEYGDIIVLSVYGHTHRNLPRVVVNKETNTPTSNIIITLAMTTPGGLPTHTDLPGGRIYELDAQTFQLQDFSTYVVNYTNYADEEEPELKLLYKQKEAYQLNDLTPQSTFNLTYRFEQDRELFNRYYTLYRRGSYSSEPCFTDKCRRKTTCVMRATTVDETQACG